MTIGLIESFYWGRSATPISLPMPSAAQVVAERAVGQQFESRFIGEYRWWPMSVEEAARTLAACGLSLDEVFARLCAGQAVASPISELRFMKTPESPHL
jgi:hypothetical protein